MPVSWTKRVSLNIVCVSRAFSANWQALYHATDICKHNYNFLCFLAHGSNWSKTENGHACTLGQIHFVTWQIAEHGQVSPCSVCKSLSCTRRHVSAQVNNCKSVWGRTLHMWAEIHFICSRLNLDVWQHKKISQHISWFLTLRTIFMQHFCQLCWLHAVVFDVLSQFHTLGAVSKSEDMCCVKNRFQCQRKTIEMVETKRCYWTF